MGGLPCARNGGSVAIRDSTMAAQILRMDHTLTSRHGLNDDFSSGRALLAFMLGKPWRGIAEGAFRLDFWRWRRTNPKPNRQRELWKRERAMGETGHRQPAGKAVTAKTRLTDRLNRRCNSYDVGGSKALTKADHREKRLPLHRTSFTPWLLGEDAPESRKKPPHNLRRYSSAHNQPASN
jgi:hypothetical protein